MVDKIRPNASVAYSYGNDGRDDHYYVSYSCPKCGKRLVNYEIACDECGTFFDWTHTAHIEIRREIVWN